MQETSMFRLDFSYYYKGSSCVNLFIEQAELGRNYFYLSNEYENLFSCNSIKEVQEAIEDLKNNKYA